MQRKNNNNNNFVKFPRKRRKMGEREREERPGVANSLVGLRVGCGRLAQLWDEDSQHASHHELEKSNGKAAPGEKQQAATSRREREREREARGRDKTHTGESEHWQARRIYKPLRISKIIY